VLTIIIISAWIRHAIASIGASTAISINLAVVTLLVAALFASNRETHLISATS
jgi:hypothetical protein